MQDNPLVRMQNVSRRFTLGETTLDAVKNVSLDIHKGEFLAVWGPSGSGKSTLMNMLGLIDAPTSGTVYFEDQNTRELSDNKLTEFRGNKIGFVFQNFNLVPVLSALENVMLPLHIQGVSEAEARARAETALADVGLSQFAKSRPDHMSGGQRQRVAIARALAVQPQLVIADEPTANLDSENSLMVVELMREMNRTKGVTFIFTTHDQRLLDHVDRKILLRDGVIESDDSIRRAPAQTERKKVINETTVEKDEVLS
ncbi:MAG: ABC transporter ATP-binding protein [Marinagarivorans sp.]|nr:ABC transporter ATP-binding protein [Marinagarivorans sp.]